MAPRKLCLPSISSLALGAMALLLLQCGQRASGGRIGSSGGTVEATAVKVEVPAGALATDLELSIVETKVAPEPEEFFEVGPQFELGPSGTQFAQPVRVEVPYDPSLLPAGFGAAELRVFGKAQGGAWEELLDTRVDATASRVNGTVTHFSSFRAGLHGCVDADGDGAGRGCGARDCNDADPAIRTGLAERCDGKDNNCDGTVDEGCSGACSTQGSCATGRTCCAGQCADTTSSASDCGGCGVACVTGQVCTAGTCGGCGTCPSGEICVNNACQLGCTPTTCTAQGKSCGMISDGCTAMLNCGSCAAGQSCVNNVCQSACTPTTCVAQGKTCGMISDGCGGSINCGACLAGMTCVSGTCQAACSAVGAACAQASSCCSLVCTNGTCGSPVEVCDGIDNDGDGLVDEGLGSSTCGVGACRVTQANCVNGVTKTCTPGAPSTEVCDGIDNNCNGVVDDGCASCTSSAQCTSGALCCSSACTNVQTSSSNCGACGAVCAAGQTCSNAVCL